MIETTIEFDPRDPAFRLNPYPTYALLQQYAPIYHWPHWNIWFVSTYADCASLLRDSRLGRTIAGAPPPPEDQPAIDAMMSKWMLLMDPPDHTRLRGLVHKAFTPRMVAQMRERVQESADELLDRVQDQGTMDLMADFAYPLPVNVICALLGVPASDHQYFHGWTEAIARSLDMTDEAEIYTQASMAAIELTNYLDGLLSERRRQPEADLFSALVAVEEEGERLSRDELFATCALLLIAGHETTVNLIGNGSLALLIHRDQWDALIENPSMAESAVEELLRYDSPVQMTARRVLEDFEYQGFLFQAGQEVGFMLGAANRDAAQFADPNRLDINRSGRSNLAFGAGIHYCLGAPLARLEGVIAFSTLTRRFPQLALSGEPVHYRDNFVLRGLEKLTVTLSK